MPTRIINLDTEGRLSPILFHPTNLERYELCTHTYAVKRMNCIGDRWKSIFVVSGKKSSRIAPHVDTMYVMETGGHKVAPVPTSTRVKKVVDYNKTMNQHHRHHESGGGGERGGGGTHIAATVKNTVRRLLRRTKSHRDTPSANASTMTPAVANGHPIVPPSTRISRNYDVPPPSSNFKRYSRARVRLQKLTFRKLELSASSLYYLNYGIVLYSSDKLCKIYCKERGGNRDKPNNLNKITVLERGIGKAWKDLETGAFLKKTTHKIKIASYFFSITHSYICIHMFCQSSSLQYILTKTLFFTLRISND
ncbi:hypothetical protein ALC62_13426 [Cyphomyrmex costatus]|uniref:Uncharacterized protein n=1 Tax=Cyphomyrmex costatus TaxID=456900 RepID=A0A195C739_9HYME|nr:hypothetical protein ALC62_13426 [Cyphomyrmex costatus]